MAELVPGVLEKILITLDVKDLIRCKSVSNPSTGEVKKLQRPQFDDNKPTVFCWGFGYDSSTDDYKVVLVYVNGNDQTCFQVLSLKSNVWKVLGKQNYTCEKHNRRKAGTLCNGALHWFMKDQNNKSVIISFDLSTEVIGWSMWFYEYLFLEKSWAKDERFLSLLNYSANSWDCVAFLISQCAFLTPVNAVKGSIDTLYGHQEDTSRFGQFHIEASFKFANKKEVDINKKAENQAKMTKLSMEWKRLCKIKAKVQKCQSQSQYRRISSQTGAGTEEYYWMQS
ncbi:F-box/kelch-repeat protein-like protein [Tanacetum coccineum]